MIKKLFSIQEASKILGVSKVTVIKRIQAGKLKAEKVGNFYVIDADDLTVISDKKVSESQKREIEESVEKTISEYGETLRLLKET